MVTITVTDRELTIIQCALNLFSIVHAEKLKPYVNDTELESLSDKLELFKTPLDND